MEIKKKSGKSAGTAEWKSGSFTVEASLLLPFLIFIIFAFFILSLYLHDRSVLASCAAELAGKGALRKYETEEHLEGWLAGQARGLAVLAHPLVYGMDISTLEKAVFHLAGLGLDGLEAYYSMNRGHDTVHMKTLAKKYRLVLSGGSDFHGDNKPHIKIGRGRGNLYVPAQILEQQKAYLSEKTASGL